MFVEVLACRLHNPWPQLQELADSIHLDTVDDVTHRHIPCGEPHALPWGSQSADHTALKPHRHLSVKATRQCIATNEKQDAVCSHYTAEGGAEVVL